jgi:hypothetical protein
MLRVFEHSMPLPVALIALYEIFLGSAASRAAMAVAVTGLAGLRRRPWPDVRRPGPKRVSGFFTMPLTSLQFRVGQSVVASRYPLMPPMKLV